MIINLQIIKRLILRIHQYEDEKLVNEMFTEAIQNKTQIKAQLRRNIYAMLKC